MLTQGIDSAREKLVPNESWGLFKRKHPLQRTQLRLPGLSVL